MDKQDSGVSRAAGRLGRALRTVVGGAAGATSTGRGSASTSESAPKKAAARKASAKKAPAKKTPAQKAPAKKAPASKAPAQEAPATKASAKKAPTKKAAATGATTAAATKNAAATKAAATKAGTATGKQAATGTKTPAKKTPATKDAAPKSAPTPKKAAAQDTAPKSAPTPKKAAARKSVSRSRAAAGAGQLVVGKDESPWTEAELHGVRTTLLEEQDRLKAELSGIEHDIQQLMRDSGDGSGDDQVDAGAKTFEREQEFTVAQNSRALLHQVERALHAIDDGSYGICESCGKPIGKLRLQAQHRATLCVTCKQEQERH